MRKSIFILSLAIIFGCCAPGRVRCAEEPAAPNIIIITVDALRVDHLGCYGYQRDTSPNIDRFAKEGVMFTQAIAQASQTAGSIPSLLSSTYSSTNGVFKFVDEPSVLTVPLLPGILKDNGYGTAAISGHGEIFASIPGMERGFDLVYDAHDAPANDIAERVLAWLEKNKNKRFFLWIHFFDTHAPYQPPYPYNELYISHELTSRDVRIYRNKFKSTGVYLDRTPKNMTQQEKDYCISQYDGEIKFVDGQMGIILNYLKTHALFRNSLIIFTADHGESLSDYNNFFGHGELLHDSVLRVPLVMRCDGALPAGEIINAQVQLIDVMPTVLDMARLIPDAKMEGESLLPMILNKETKHSPYAFSETANKEFIMRSIRSPQWKLTYEKLNSRDWKQYELYNLESDPEESTNVAESEKERFQTLKAELERWINRPKPDITAVKAPIDEETKENLKSLGYLQ